MREPFSSTPIASSTPEPLSAEILLQQRSCCGNGCKNCPYRTLENQAHLKGTIRLSSRWRRQVLFDFDGTLANSLPAQQAVFKQLNNKYHFIPNWEYREKEVWDEIRELGTFGALKKFKIPMWRLPFLIAEAQNQMEPFWDEVLLYPGIAEMLITLHQQGHTLGIVTANRRQVVQEFLRKQKLLHLFSAIESVSILQTKARVLQKLQRQTSQPNQTLFIGDELRDVEAADKASAPFIGVGWGVNPAKRLRRETVLVVETPQELLHSIEDWITYGQNPAEKLTTARTNN